MSSLVVHCKKRSTSFPSPAGMSLTKLPLGRNNSVMTSIIPPRESLVVTSRLGTGNLRNFFLQCTPCDSRIQWPRGFLCLLAGLSYGFVPNAWSIQRWNMEHLKCLPSHSSVPLKVYRKKAFWYSRPQPGRHLPNSLWAGIITSYINYSHPGRVW